MNFYSDDIFCKAMEAAYFSSDRQIEPNFFELDGQLWKILTVNSTQPIVKFPFQSTFIDFYEPDDRESTNSSHEVQKLDYIPKACHGLVTSDEWVSRQLCKHYEPAPTILWNQFASWDEFTKYVRQKRSNLFSDSRRRFRKLEKEAGTLNFVFDDRRTDVLDTCMQWKSEQYRLSGYIDNFAYEEHRRLFQELFNRGLLLVSTLNSGDKLIAAHLGVLSQGRLYWWIPAYDTSYQVYSPGRLLLELILQESFNLKHQEFDFLIGDEPYKWYYATHTRLIAEMGIPPTSIQIERSIKSVIKPIVSSALRPFPDLQDSWQNFRYKMRKKSYESTKR